MNTHTAEAIKLKVAPPPDLSQAMFATAIPCNPTPFAIALAENVHHYGTDWIKTDEAKRILFVLNMQAYGQLFHLDAPAEFERLLSTNKKSQ